MNRKEYRQAGLQGRKGSITHKKSGQVMGRPKGKFLGANGRPSTLVPYASSRRRITRIVARQAGAMLNEAWRQRKESDSAEAQ
jgi:hypothetical protein